MSTSPVNVSNTQNTAGAAASATSGASSLANQNVFLQLLVAQLQYQDPSQPADGTQFVTQLAEFTNVSNTTAMAGDLGTINTNIGTLTTDLTTPPATSTTNTSGTTPTNSNS